MPARGAQKAPPGTRAARQSGLRVRCASWLCPLAFLNGAERGRVLRRFALAAAGLVSLDQQELNLAVGHIAGAKLKCDLAFLRGARGVPLLQQQPGGFEVRVARVRRQLQSALDEA